MKIHTESCKLKYLFNLTKAYFSQVKEKETKRKFNSAHRAICNTTAVNFWRLFYGKNILYNMNRRAVSLLRQVSCVLY